MTPLVYTIDQVARMLAADRKTVYALVHSGELYAVRLGRALRVPRAALDHFLRPEQAGPEKGDANG